MQKGQLVRNIKGNKNLGVVKDILGDDQVRVLFSASGSDRLADVAADDVEVMNVTAEFISLFKELN